LAFAVNFYTERKYCNYKEIAGSFVVLNGLIKNKQNALRKSNFKTRILFNFDIFIIFLSLNSNTKN